MSLLFCSRIFCATSIALGYLAFVFWWRGACGRFCRALVKLALVVSSPFPLKVRGPATLFRNARYHAAVEDQSPRRTQRPEWSKAMVACVPWSGFFFQLRSDTCVTAND